ncbi:hypothetical protein ANCCEY_10378 [Ancylostoma ceylanicum]|uniref:Uncharacterized protein n=1 Tax=Ancylostoma ceylanicum TaxID=53326 RepID=A0A0D6LEL0_9BILA|nr:hypothetical protein ANCCEY_10378 [Ancylostoma ceylanicum]
MFIIDVAIRACRHRPSLSFCSDFDSLPEPRTNDAVPLITPPPIEADQKPLQHDLQVPILIKLPVTLPEMENTASLPQAVTAESSNITAASIEDEKSVLVFVSEYCVVERERFIKNCHGDVSEDQVKRFSPYVPFCKSYPAACASTAGVIPVVSYCQRYYKHYPKFCGGPKIEQDVLQFCFAFEQFCLPELTPAQPCIMNVEEMVPQLCNCVLATVEWEDRQDDVVDTIS